ncbi:MAG: amidase, partial [Mesorhizobium sp.]
MTGTRGPLNAFLDLGDIPVSNAQSGPLAGLRLAVKDIYDVAGYRTGCGSIRAPASFCGLIGLRTTHGRISLKGAMPLAPSLDTFGWFARDMATYEKVGTVLLGDDRQRHDLARALALDALDGLVLGPQQADQYRAMVRTVASVLGAPRTVAPLSHSTDDLYWCFRKLQGYEAWQNHGAWVSQGDRMLGPGVKERFEHGATIDLATAQ